MYVYLDMFKCQLCYYIWNVECVDYVNDNENLFGFFIIKRCFEGIKIMFNYCDKKFVNLCDGGRGLN